MRRLLPLLAAAAAALTAPALAGGPSALTHTPGWDDGPLGWSPDGTRIQVGSIWTPPKDSFDAIVRVAGLDGSVSRALPRAYREWDTPGAWSPDGTRFVDSRGFELPGENAGADLFLSRGDGTDARNVTQTPVPGELDPQWAPDGSAVLYTRTATPGGSSEIWTMRPDGTGEHLLTAGFGARWSPDGSLLVLGRRAARDDELWVVTADGLAANRVAERGAYPQWSPDGSRIAYWRSGGPTGDLWIVGADGTDERRIATRVDSVGFAWAPGGTELLVQRGADQGRPVLSFVNAATGAPRPLVDGSHPEYSPDGSTIAFDRGGVPGDRSPAGLYVIHPDGSGLRRIASGLLGPQWSPEGRSVVGEGAGPCLNAGVYAVTVETGAARRLTGDCEIDGTAGGDVLLGTSERDVIRGLGGNDTIRANPSDLPNAYYGRVDDDLVDAGPGNDVLTGGRGADVLLGGPGNDRLDGGRGADTLTGGAGDDVLTGGRYYDRLSGGGGNDRILARDGFKDRIACGPGRDTVEADRSDVVARDCELVRRRMSHVAGP